MAASAGACPDEDREQDLDFTGNGPDGVPGADWSDTLPAGPVDVPADEPAARGTEDVAVHPAAITAAANATSVLTAISFITFTLTRSAAARLLRLTWAFLTTPRGLGLVLMRAS